MKLNRRSFIALIVGGAAGIGFTPLPWKLTDDSAIWTQNWPWVPKSIRYPNIEYADTVCDLCQGGCGIKVRMVNNKNMVKVEGAQAAPVNQGGVCPMSAAGAQYQYHTARFKGPLKLFGARGSGAYEKLSWSKATKAVGAKLKELRDHGQANTVVLISGRRDGLAKEASRRFLTAYGSPNFVEMPGLEVSKKVAETAQFGPVEGIGYDLENASFVLSFGSAIIEGWGSPIRSIRAYSSWQSDKKAKLVQVDNRASLTASKADEWYAVKPGTEAALALGLSNVILKEGLYDSKWIIDNTEGFDEFRAMVLKEYTPAKVAEITGLAEDKIVALAKEFASAKPAVAIAGRGSGAMPTPVYELMAVMALNALVGNINERGGVIIRKDLPLTTWGAFQPDANAQQSLAAPRIDEAGSVKYPLTPSILENLTEAINSGEAKVNMVILDQANPAYFGGDPTAFATALSKVPTVVTLNTLGDDTSILADYVLPQTSPFDGPVEVQNPPTLPYPLFGMGDAVLDGRFDCLPVADIYVRLAKETGGNVLEALPFKNHRDMVKQAVVGLYESGRGTVVDPDGKEPGNLFGQEVMAGKFKDAKAFGKALAKGKFWYDPVFTYGQNQGAFKTPSGKFEFFSLGLQAALGRFIVTNGEKAMKELGIEAKIDLAFMPHFEPTMPEVDEKDPVFPLTLMPVEQFKLVNSAWANAPYLTKLLEDITLKETDLVVEINPETGHKLHLHNGEKAMLKTLKGQVQVRVYHYIGVAPGVICAPIGLGHRGYGYYLRGKGANPMELADVIRDPLSGQALWWGTKANLTKV